MMMDSREIYGVILYAWVLMENHFHLLLETPLGNLEHFMRRFNISYTGYFNRKYHRVGHLYQGRYKSILVEKECYLSTLSRYIHLNPIRVKGLISRTPGEKIKFLNSYSWSTLKGYLDSKYKITGVDYKLILGEFGGDNSRGRRVYLKRITADIREKLDKPGEIVGGSIMGGEDFIGWVKENFLAPGLDKEVKGARQIKGYKARQKILGVLREETGKTLEEIKSEKGEVRSLAMELLYRIGGLNGVEIGEIFRISYNAVSLERKRLIGKMKENLKLKKLYGTLAGKLE
jgi:putative transposase